MSFFGKKIAAVLILSFIVFSFGAGLAQAAGLCQTCNAATPCDKGLTCDKGKCRGVPETDTIIIPNPLKACEIQEVIDSVINFIFIISLAIAPLMIIVAAVYLLVSGGDPGKIKTAKDIILYTAIGLLIIMLARGLIAVIKQVLGS